jgi:hypothetical protein
VQLGWSHILYGIFRHPPLLLLHRHLPIQYCLHLGRPEPSRASFWTSMCRSTFAFKRSGIKLGVVEPSEAGERRDDTELETGPPSNWTSQVRPMTCSTISPFCWPPPFSWTQIPAPSFTSCGPFTTESLDSRSCSFSWM